MATLGFQILLESARELVVGVHPNKDHDNEMWVIVTSVKFILMVYCRRFENEIVRAYAQDHFFDVITNFVGLGATFLAIRYKWWIDAVGAIIIALYTINTWAKTVIENVWSLIGRTAPPEFLAKLTYLVLNHHEEIKHIDTVRAYTFGSHYFVEVDIVCNIRDFSENTNKGQLRNTMYYFERQQEPERQVINTGHDTLNETRNESFNSNYLQFIKFSKLYFIL